MIRADASTVELWEIARSINAGPMAWARVVHMARKRDDRVWVTVAISREIYVDTLVGMDGVASRVPSAIAAILCADASDIVTADEIARECMEIPIGKVPDKLGDTSCLVDWSWCDAVNVKRAVEETLGIANEVRLERLQLSGKPDMMVSLLVSMPEPIYAQVVETFFAPGSRRSDNEVVYMVIMDVCRADHTAQSHDLGLPHIKVASETDHIPF